MKFYDTCSLLNLLDKAFEEEFMCSYKTLQEIEHIKTSDRKDQDVKYRARKLAHLFDENLGKYKISKVSYADILDTFKQFGLEETPDNIIVATAYLEKQKNTDLLFYSEDICCKNIARTVFGMDVESISNNNADEEYTGFKEVVLSDDKMAYFYEHLSENQFGLYENQYMIIRSLNNDVVDKLVWRNGTHEHIKFSTMKSEMFGTLKPYKGDIYQQCVIDSMITNQLTMIKGKAGTGKSYLALSYLFYLLEKHKIDKIVVFTNTQPTANSATLGFYPGTRDEKLLESNIGNMLSSKFGDSYVTEKLISENKLILLPMCDIRGYDTSGMNCAVYITEAENMDINLMKLALQRIGEDSICIIEGDYKTQVDLVQYSGSNNGMRRMSEIFRGQDFYGEVELQNIYRSRIADIAERM